MTDWKREDLKDLNDLAPGDAIDGTPVAYAYTRKMALEDGVLVDVSSLGRRQGFKLPVALTAGLWSKLHKTEDEALLYVNIRILYLFAVLHEQIKVWLAPGTNSGTHVQLKLYYPDIGDVECYAVCGPGDQDEPVCTILLPHEN